MEQIAKAIESAFTAQIVRSYNVLSEGLAAAGDDAQKQTEAVEKFKKGLAFATSVRTSARTAAGL